MTQIHEAMSKAMGIICTLGIAKTQKNTQQGYNFRGIDAAMSEMSPILVRCGITVTPVYSDAHIEFREKEAGKFLRFALVKGTFIFSVADGSSVSAVVYGESMDSGDKALTKAQSVAFRTALFQTFVVPLMAMDPEADYYEAPQEPESLDKARDAALGGTAAFRDWWKGQPATVRTELGKYMPELQQAATAADGAQK